MTTWLQPSATAAVSIVLLLAGCSQSTSKPAAPTAAQAQPAAPPELITAKTAFWPMYKAAHNWAPDVEAIRVTAKEVPGFKNAAGRAAMWEAVFASPSLHQYETFSDSIADAPPNIYKGVVAGLAQPWGGETRDAMPIDVTSFNVDSDAAYTAAAAGAADWLKQNPGKDLGAFELGDTYKFQVPVWYVMWGTKAAGYATIVDASAGKVLHK
ncbi:MAG: hypothetical protein WCC27_06210 [Acidobacteriaceae bacterium]